MSKENTFADEEVAREFATLYYDTAANNPSNLFTFYMSDSSVSHGIITASGLEEISEMMPKHPIIAQKVILFSVSVQNDSSGSYLVMAMGSMPNGRPFTQIFKLEHVKGDKTRNMMYCRNDILKLVPEDVKAAADAFVQCNHEKGLLDPDSPFIDTISHVSSRMLKLNSLARGLVPGPLVAVESTTESIGTSVPSSQATTVPTSPSWSSIAAKAPVYQLFVVNRAETDDAHDTGSRGRMCNRGRYSRGRLHSRKSNALVQYEMSVLIRLSSFGLDWLEDLVSLRRAIFKEFSSYGFPVWNVSIRPYIDLVFVDYSSNEAAQMAVKVWSQGSRAHGLFAGQQLNVFEKHPPRNAKCEVRHRSGRPE